MDLGERARPNRLRDARLAEVAECTAWAHERVAALSEDAFFAAGIALYAGEGSKRDGDLAFANTDARMVAFFCAWLRRYFDLDETRLRCRLYLHDDLDLAAAVAAWSEVTGIPAAQFTAPYRPATGPRRGVRRHPHGCVTVRYACSRTHRRIIALCDVLLSFRAADPA